MDLESAENIMSIPTGKCLARVSNVESHHDTLVVSVLLAMWVFRSSSSLLTIFNCLKLQLSTLASKND